MAPHPDGPIETPFHQKVEDFKRRTLPLLVWSISLVVVLALLFGRVRRFEYVGLAQSQEYEVSAATTGTLENVLVSLYDQVEAGEVVATLDASALQASIDTAQALVRQQQAELASVRAQLGRDNNEGAAAWTSDLRRFQMDEEQRRLDGMELKVLIDSDQLELERQDLELRRFRQLRESGLISQSELESVQLGRDQVERRLQENRALLRQTEQQLGAASARRQSFQARMAPGGAVDPVLQPILQAIAVETNRLKEIEKQRDALVLRSPVAGQVSQLLCRNGQSLVPGEPIMMIAERSVSEVVAYLRDGDPPRRIRPNTKALLASREEPGRVAESLVVRVGETVGPLPQRLWRDPRVPDYGRAVVVAAAPALDIRPGQVVEVTFPAAD